MFRGPNRVKSQGLGEIGHAKHMLIDLTVGVVTIEILDEHCKPYVHIVLLVLNYGTGESKNRAAAQESIINELQAMA
jgi:hypothetical protein